MVEKFHDWEDIVVVWAENQEWDDATLAQLRKEYNIFYERGTYIPVMLYRFSKKSGGMIVFGFEDDGTISFTRNECGSFDDVMSLYWVDDLIQDLTDAKEYVENGGKV